MDDDLVVVHTLATRFEADLLVDALEREGIPTLLRTFEETAYDGLFVPQRGWGKILVAPAHVGRARALIEPLASELSGRRLYESPLEIDPRLWEELGRASPDAICRQAQVRYDAARGAYRLPFLNVHCDCIPEERAIELTRPGPYPPLNFELYLTTLHYLLEARTEPLSGKWVGEQDLPGGNLFFRGPHQFHTQPLLKRFGSHPERFAAAAEALGGSRVAAGDTAYRFWAFPRVPLLFVLWWGDEEFVPALHIRFDPTVTRQIHTLDTLWALVNLVCRCLRIAADSVPGVRSA
jgi:hypothetical protein